MTRNPNPDRVPPSSDGQIEGRNPVAEALRAGRSINRLYVLNRARGGRGDTVLSELAEKARAAGATVSYVDRTALDRMATTGAHQGIIARVAAHDYADLDAILAEADASGRDPFFILLDNLQDPHNLGAILRVADAAGVDAVILPRHRSVTLDATVAKTSAGALEYVPVCRVTNLTRTVLDLKARGFWIFGTAAEAASDYHEVDWSGRVALVIGSEGRGIGDKLLEHCDFRLAIPQVGNVNSLNASVACGIITFEAMHCRRGRAHDA